MKAASVEKKENNKKSSKKSIPFQKVLMGIRMNDSAISNLKYIDLSSQALQFKQLAFLHVTSIYNRWLFEKGRAI